MTPQLYFTELTLLGSVAYTSICLLMLRMFWWNYNQLSDRINIKQAELLWEWHKNTFLIDLFYLKFEVFQLNLYVSVIMILKYLVNLTNSIDYLIIQSLKNDPYTHDSTAMLGLLLKKIIQLVTDNIIIYFASDNVNLRLPNKSRSTPKLIRWRS